MILHTAVMENNIRMVFQLFNSGAEINMTNSLFNTPLHIADAVQVIDRSLDWIRTDDIGELAQLRAYLGYCSRALVLLETRILLMSQPANE